jgi:hypothetical protein
MTKDAEMLVPEAPPISAERRSLRHGR